MHIDNTSTIRKGPSDNLLICTKLPRSQSGVQLHWTRESLQRKRTVESTSRRSFRGRIVARASPRLKNRQRLRPNCSRRYIDRFGSIDRLTAIIARQFRLRCHRPSAFHHHWKLSSLDGCYTTCRTLGLRTSLAGRKCLRAYMAAPGIELSQILKPYSS